MRGSVAKKGKRWYAVVYDGVDPVTGKYRRRWVPAGTRRGDAEKVLADLVKRSHEGNTVVSEKVSSGRTSPVAGFRCNSRDCGGARTTPIAATSSVTSCLRSAPCHSTS